MADSGSAGTRRDAAGARDVTGARDPAGARRARPGRASHGVPENSLGAVDRCSTEPLYRQLREELARGIAAGTLDPEAPLPSSRQLAAQFGLSRNTINAAYQELIADGVIDARPRRGLFVNRAAYTGTAGPALGVENGSVVAGTRPDTGQQALDWSERLGPPQADDLPHADRFADWHRMPYPFVTGQPDPAHFPSREWTRALRDALLPEHVHASLDDGAGAGDDRLLTTALCEHVLAGRGIAADPDQVLITMGSQHALHLLAATLIRPGGTVGVEEPGSLDARQILLRAGARILPLPVDAEGLVLPLPHQSPAPPLSPREPADQPADLELLYLTPGRHRPTNVALSLERRKLLLSALAGRETVIIEDDCDGEPYCPGPSIPTLKSLDGTGRVVYLGTASTFLAPGLRIGYLVADRGLVAELRERRRYQLRRPPGQTQRALGLLIAGGQYQRIIRLYHQRMDRRRTAIVDAVQTHLPGLGDYPPGGSSLWLTGPPTLDCRRLQTAALKQGVVIERGDVFFAAAPPPRHHLRLGFGSIHRDQIEPGIRLLADLIEHCDADPLTV
ncbi:MAG TPA: PLP-dependent aminotransferase family protein [Actinocrinis sp.]|nr:PLP-dependent aminotransferase family protein [Actinocrinis sp.]